MNCGYTQKTQIKGFITYEEIGGRGVTLSTRHTTGINVV